MPEKETVLVIDDEREIAQMACIRLRGAGYETLTAANGQAGVDKAAMEQPSAIVLDVRMPVMDGMTALAELKARGDTRNIPVVMLSASLVDKPVALDAGARFFLTKPYDAANLIAAVNTAIMEASDS